jgi:hypothetical protein
LPAWLTNVLTGIGPWTNTWYLAGVTNQQVVGAAGQAGPYTNIQAVYPTNSFTANTPSNNVYHLLSVYNGDTCGGNEPGDVVGAVTNTVNPTLMVSTVPAGVPGVATNSAGQILETNVLGQPEWLAVTNQPYYLVDWYDASETLVATNTFVYVPANSLVGYYTNYAGVQDSNTLCQGASMVAVIQVLVPPAPVSSGNQTNCAGVANPALAVTLPEVVTGATVNWYYDAAGTQPVPEGAATNSFTPTNTLAGSYSYYAQTVTNGLASTNLTPVMLVLESCTNAPTIFTYGQPATNSVITWFGNLLLESTTNLSPPVNWITNSTGLPGITNQWINTNMTLPNQFFRLYAPTN